MASCSATASSALAGTGRPEPSSGTYAPWRPDGDAGSSSGDVAARLGRGVNSFGPARASLISKGLIFAPEHGIVAFTVPGMADFIQRQPNP